MSVEFKSDGSPYKTPKHIREAIKRYMHTEKGRATRARYKKKKYWEDPEKARAIQRARFAKSPQRRSDFPISYLRHIDISVPIIVMVEKDGDGYHSWCPLLKGLHTEGYCLINAVANAKLAAEAYLMSLIKHGEPIPTSIKE